MKWKWLVLTGLMVSLLNVYGQSDCSGGRYVDYDHFNSFSVTADIQYGQNIGVSGSTEDLFLDIYEPVGDTYQNRPVVVVAFGGSFVGGSKEDVEFACRIFAKLGYVVVAPSYRVGFFFPTSYTTSLAVLRGAHDMKACLRYLYRSVADMGNPYGIDTTRIIAGGISAGAISALHAVYLDEQSEIPPVLQPDTASFGNVPGNSGNLGYSEKVLALWSMSGAISDTLMIQAGDEPLVSIHEVDDPVVPYDTDGVSVLAIPTGLTASGSSHIHRYMNTLGIDNCFLSYPGNGHVGYLLDDSLGSFGFLVDFMADMVCSQTLDCGQIIASIQKHDELEVSLAPNPVAQNLSVNLNSASTIEVFDQHGRIIFTDRLQEGRSIVNAAQLSSGSYVMRVNSGASVTHARFIKE